MTDRYYNVGRSVEYRDNPNAPSEHIAVGQDVEKAHFLAVAANSHSFKYTIGAVERWAHDRNLIDVQTSHPQVTKLFEEGGEVAAAVARQDRDALKDAIGDVTVVLVILAAQNGLTFEECVAAAYNEIKDRKGRMIDGVFVRET